MSETLRDAIGERIELFPKPTPLISLESFSSDLGVDVCVKRDDQTAIGGGGNKARKLEFIAYEALQSGADTFVTVGSAQSNHARMTAAVANRLDLDCHLVLIGEDDGERVKGNRLLETILGADVSFTTAADASDEIDTVVERLKQEDANPFFIDGGGHMPTGALGYVECASEIREQCPDADYVVTTTGTGTTQAGLLAGLAWENMSTTVIGISIARSKSRCQEEIRDTIASLEGRYKDLCTKNPGILVFEDYIGDGYGKLTKKGRDAIIQMSRLEGIFLDPTYTAKAFAGLINLVEKGYIEQESRIVFINTGGLPGLFTDRFESRKIWER
jgi:D-cysteine desulfhydrase family pyridoxal phosphate-dependent enzyme